MDSEAEEVSFCPDYEDDSSLASSEEGVEVAVVGDVENEEVEEEEETSSGEEEEDDDDAVFSKALIKYDVDYKLNIADHEKTTYQINLPAGLRVFHNVPKSSGTSIEFLMREIGST